MQNLEIDILNEDNLYTPKTTILEQCFKLVADYHNISQATVNVSIVCNDEIQQINKEFRKKDSPTNIISFEFDRPEGLPDDIMLEFLGDIVIAPEVLETEASQQGKNLDDHWCHIFIHGLLHLLKYDHIDDNEAEQMESLEIELLSKMNISNPYLS